MGYSTYLYAVDIRELQNAIGSNDAKLLRRIKKIRTSFDVESDRVAASKIARVKYGLNGDLFLNGEKVTLDAIKAFFTNIGEQGALFSYHEPHPKGYWPPAQKASYNAVINTALQCRGCRFMGCSSDEDLRTAKWEDEEDEGRRFRKKAIAELISGQFTRPEFAHEYGYALERLCEVIGSRIRETEFMNLSDLRIDSPLSKPRLPVPIPKPDDFPFISYLVADEVETEVRRLTAVDLSYPNDPSIEEERKKLFSILEGLIQNKLGVVSFYY